MLNNILLKAKFLKQYLHYYEKLQCFAIIFIVSPGFYTYQMAIVFPSLMEIYKPSTLKLCFYVMLSGFFFINIMGNMMMCVTVDSSCKGLQDHPWNKDEVTVTSPKSNYCSVCHIEQPPRTWHCNTCNACVLRRDHHCFFFSRCIGLRNQRYFLLWLFYVAVSVSYCSFHDYIYLQNKFDNFSLLASGLSIWVPMVRYFNGFSYKDMCGFFFMFNILLIVWVGGMFVFHIRNVINGVTAYESGRPRGQVFNKNWNNLKYVFGSRWYFAVLWPFAFSPVYDNVDKIV